MKANARCRHFQIPLNPDNIMSSLRLAAAIAILAATSPLVATAEVLQASSAEPAPAPIVRSKVMAAQGPLRVHPANPRYFTDGSGRAILLTGSHTWGNLQDYRYATLPSPPPMDFGAYLAFLRRHHHNFFRLWAWETAFNPNAKQGTTFFDPMPCQRPGPGNALDGKPKFDLALFNPTYFWIGLKADGPAAQRAWVWENFTRGNQCLFMDPYLDPSHDPGRNHPTLGQPDSYWDTLRQAMGHTLSCAERMNLASMRPHGEVASTGFCLADPGREYLVYLPQAGEVTVDLGPASGQMNVEWRSAAEGTLRHAEPVLGGGQRTLRSPFDGDAVLHLWSK